MDRLASLGAFVLAALAAVGAAGPSLDFDGQTSRVSGSTGCNRLAGGYTSDEGTLHFTPLVTTRMFCPSPPVDEQAFLDALASVTAYRIEDGTLRLLAGTKPVLLFHSSASSPQQSGHS